MTALFFKNSLRLSDVIPFQKSSATLFVFYFLSWSLVFAVFRQTNSRFFRTRWPLFSLNNDALPDTTLLFQHGRLRTSVAELWECFGAEGMQENRWNFQLIIIEDTGDVPYYLKGTMLRNGPGLFSIGETVYNHYFDGLAYIQRFHFQDGKVDYVEISASWRLRCGILPVFWNQTNTKKTSKRRGSSTVSSELISIQIRVNPYLLGFRLLV